MSVPAWSPEGKARAKKERRHLLKLFLQGRYAEEGPWAGGSVGLSSTISADAARALMFVCDAESFGVDKIRFMSAPRKRLVVEALKHFLMAAEDAPVQQS